jgi:Mn-dependent DtxR family transcriptional regulator
MNIGGLMPFKYPNPPKLQIMEIISYMQQNPEKIYFNIELLNYFKTSPQDMSNRLRKLRFWGMIKYAFKKQRGYGGYVLTDYGKTIRNKN